MPPLYPAVLVVLSLAPWRGVLTEGGDRLITEAGEPLLQEEN